MYLFPQTCSDQVHTNLPYVEPRCRRHRLAVPGATAQIRGRQTDNDSNTYRLVKGVPRCRANFSVTVDDIRQHALVSVCCLFTKSSVSLIVIGLLPPTQKPRRKRNGKPSKVCIHYHIYIYIHMSMCICVYV